jgi:hypothetical protein
VQQERWAQVLFIFRYINILYLYIYIRMREYNATRDGGIKGLLRLYKALFRLYSGSIKGLLRHY